MRYFSGIFVVLVALAGAGFAQPPTVMWSQVYGSQTEYGEEMRTICQTVDGGFLLAGLTYETNQMLAIRIDSLGSEIWSRCYGGNTYYVANTVIAMPNGDFILAGGKGDSVYTMRINASGDSLWGRSFRYNQHRWCEATASTIASDSTILVVGRGQAIYAIMYSANGDTLWSHVYGVGQDAWGRGVVRTSNGGFLIAGGRRAEIGDAVYILRLTSRGDTVWTRTIDGPSDEYARSILFESDTGFTVFGGIGSSIDPQNQFYLLDCNSNGDTLWTRRYGNMGGPIPFAFCRARGGGYVMMGTVVDVSQWQQAQMFALRVNAQGDTLWSSIYPRSEADQGRCILETTDGGYAIGGMSHTPGRGNDFYLVRTRPDPQDVGAVRDIIPDDFEVSVYPNPFNATTTISFTLPKTAVVDLKVYDLTGRLVRTLAGGCNPPLHAGTHDIAFDGSGLASGIYFVRLEAGEVSQTRKIVLLK